MMLEDCPVGSVVRLVSFEGHKGYAHPWWKGNFKVELGIDGKFVVDGDGNIRNEYYHREDYQFEIVHPAPEPCITFTVGGQEFYVGQRVWGTRNSHECVEDGQEAVICGHRNFNLAVRVLSNSYVYEVPAVSLQLTPPAPHEWKRGDWARHEDGSVYLVVKVMDNKIVLTGCGFADCAEMKQAHPRDPKLTFITHTEIPK